MSPAVSITRSPGCCDLAWKDDSGVFWLSFPTFDALGWGDSAKGERDFLNDWKLLPDLCFL